MSRTCMPWPVGIVLSIVLLALPAGAGATTAASALSVAELTEASDLVVHGRVGTMHSYTEGDRIFTAVEVQVENALKGDTAGGPLTLKLLGGEADGLRTVVIGAPCISSGEEVVFFLKANGAATYDVVNLAEGAFEVVRSDDGSATLRRDLRGIQYLEESTPPDLPETLEALSDAVRAAAGETPADMH